MPTDTAFQLNKKQQAAFNRLKKAYNDCMKLKMGVYNNYGIIGFFDTAKITDYNDNSDKVEAVYDNGQNHHNEIRSVCSWADDTHYFHLKNQTP